MSVLGVYDEFICYFSTSDRIPDPNIKVTKAKEMIPISPKIHFND